MMTICLLLEITGKNRSNRYFRRSKISEAKFHQLVRHFSLDLTATESAALTGISIRSTNAIDLRIRERMMLWCEVQSPFWGELEADQSYFGARRVRGKRGRGAGGKTVVFSLLKRSNEVYTEIVSSASKSILQAIIRGKADPHNVIHTDRWRGYDGLVEVGFENHFSGQS